jgi:hypothetical protein
MRVIQGEIKAFAIKNELNAQFVVFLLDGHCNQQISILLRISGACSTRDLDCASQIGVGTSRNFGKPLKLFGTMRYLLKNTSISGLSRYRKDRKSHISQGKCNRLLKQRYKQVI